MISSAGSSNGNPHDLIIGLLAIGATVIIMWATAKLVRKWH